MVSHEFQVTNTTGVRVEILGEVHSCTCTEVAVRRGVIEPGETIALTLNVKPYVNRSDGWVSCTLKTDHPRWKDWTYRLQYRCFPDARFVPDRIDLGTHWIDEPPPAEDGGKPRAPDMWLEVYGEASKKPLRDWRLEAPLGITATLGFTPETVDDGGVRKLRYPVTLKLDRGTTRIGTHTQSLTFRGISALPTFSSVSWTISSPLTVDPPQAFVGVLGTASAPEPIRLVLRSVRGASFRILSVKTDSDLVAAAAESPDEAGDRHSVVIRATAAKSPGNAAATSGDVAIKTDLAGAETVHVPWSAFIRR